MEITPDEIAVRAYERFLARSGVHGHDVEDWLAAAEDLRRIRQRYDVELLEPGPRTIELVRVIRDVTGMSLRDIGVIVDSPPGTLWRDAASADAERLETQLAEHSCRMMRMARGTLVAVAACGSTRPPPPDSASHATRSTSATYRRDVVASS